jgi:hypothetical protein
VKSWLAALFDRFCLKAAPKRAQLFGIVKMQRLLVKHREQLAPIPQLENGSQS